MLELLARLEAGLREHRPEYLESLQPGIDPAALEAFEARFGLTLPEAFKQLYRWRNGQDSTNFSSLQDNRMFSALEDVTESKAMLDDMIGTDFEDPNWWLRTWVPFLSNGAGDHLCVDTRNGALVAFWHDWEDRRQEYGSLEDWLAALVEQAERGELEVD